MKFDNSSRRRVVVTGIGAVTPLAHTLDQSWDALLLGEHGIGPITQFDATGFKSRIAGEVKNFDPEGIIPRKDLKKLDRFIQLAVVAAHEAIHNAAFAPGYLTDARLNRFGTIIGSGIGGLISIYKEARRYFIPESDAHPSEGTSPFFIPKLIVNQAAGYISIQHGLRGPNLAIASACATSAHCVGEAALKIRHNEADCMLAGGSDALITELAVGGFSAMGALSTRNDDPATASRPFDVGRDGFVIAEGAAILVLEERNRAIRRGANIIAEIVGYGTTGDAHSLFQPHPDGVGAQRAMRLALADAKMKPCEIEYINAHGTSTPQGDEIECRAIRSVFGDHADRLLISSTKGSTGHLVGAAGVFEAAVCAMVVKTGDVPPTINIEKLSDGCRLRGMIVNEQAVVGAGRENTALSNSFGFGGTNATLIFRDPNWR